MITQQRDALINLETDHVQASRFLIGLFTEVLQFTPLQPVEMDLLVRQLFGIAAIMVKAEIGVSVKHRVGDQALEGTLVLGMVLSHTQGKAFRIRSDEFAALLAAHDVSTQWHRPGTAEAATIDEEVVEKEVTSIQAGLSVVVFIPREAPVIATRGDRVIVDDLANTDELVLVIEISETKEDIGVPTYVWYIGLALALVVLGIVLYTALM